MRPEMKKRGVSILVITYSTVYAKGTTLVK